MKPLRGTLVVDFTQFLSGPFCTMLLGDLGAEVIKVERPGSGEVYRTYGPKFIKGESTSFLSVNRNKKSLTLDLKKPEATEVVHRLARKADILVENFKPGTMERLGLGYDVLCSVNPGLIYCSISGFGQTGPYRELGGFDLILQGMTGIMSVTGEPDGDPVKVGYPVTDLGAGMYAALGILAAFIARSQTGKGQLVDTSLLEAGLSWAILPATAMFADGEVPSRLGSASAQNAPYQGFETRDGYITLGTGNDELWRRLCEALHLTELLQDPRFQDNASRVKNQKDLASAIAPAIRSMDTGDCLALLKGVGIPCGPIYDLAEALSDPQAISRDMVVEYEHPVAGTIKSVGFPIKFSDVEFTISPPPQLGEHNWEVLLSLGYSDEEVRRFEETGLI